MANPSRVLIAGAGGVLGRLVAAELVRRGISVRSVSRRPHPSLARLTGDHRVIDALTPHAWKGACDGVDAVFSSLGASVAPSPFVARRTYTRVDAPANIALLEEARRSGVRRFVYTSLITGDTTRHLDYAEGHERVVDALANSGMPCSVLRPTGFFAAMCAMIDFARHGMVPVIGDGHWPTNPISEEDLAECAVEELLSDAPGIRQVPLGGPEAYSRRRIAELAFEALGKRPRLLYAAPRLMLLAAAMTQPLNPRAAHFTRFATHVMTHPCLAPAVGRRRLEDAFKAYARRNSA